MVPKNLFAGSSGETDIENRLNRHRERGGESEI